MNFGWIKYKYNIIRLSVSFFSPFECLEIIPTKNSFNRLSFTLIFISTKRSISHSFLMFLTLDALDKWTMRAILRTTSIPDECHDITDPNLRHLTGQYCNTFQSVFICILKWFLICLNCLSYAHLLNCIINPFIENLCKYIW